LLELRDLFGGDFLEGLYLRNCNEFNEMILFERVVCQNKQIEILEKLIGLYDDQEQFEEELQILNEAAAIEPYNEHFAYQAIRVYGKLGNRTAAINYYKNFEIVLRRNLNTSPNSELRLLYKEMLESSGNPRVESRSRDRVTKRRLDLTIAGMKDIEYSGLAEMTDQIFCRADRKYLFELEQPYLADLSHICSGFKRDYNEMAPGFADACSSVPSVRVAFAFLRLVEHAAERYEIHIKAGELDEIDLVSRNVLLRLDRLKTDHITIEY
jgi:tetratricopeptide (TPR) repeat protein